MILKARLQKELGKGKKLLVNFKDEIYNVEFSEENTYLDIANYILENFNKYLPICHVYIEVVGEILTKDDFPEDGIMISMNFKKIMKFFIIDHFWVRRKRRIFDEIY